MSRIHPKIPTMYLSIDPTQADFSMFTNTLTEKLPSVCPACIQGWMSDSHLSLSWLSDASSFGLRTILGSAAVVQETRRSTKACSWCRISDAVADGIATKKMVIFLGEGLAFCAVLRLLLLMKSRGNESLESSL
ncbi:hypothetical protein BDR07DRAFT_1440927 [Suillus spraguei]|nr:hypothetical protein BDR07DRAFT_1440927 [Suillus spraguei]